MRKYFSTRYVNGQRTFETVFCIAHYYGNANLIVVMRITLTRMVEIITTNNIWQWNRCKSHQIVHISSGHEKYHHTECYGSY